MKIHHAGATVKTGTRIGVEDLTPLVRREIADSGIASGIAIVSVPHTTCSVVVNESEDGLREDIRRLADRLLDPLAAGAPFAHDAIDDNARAHLTAVLMGHQVTIPVAGGEPALGAWQSVLLVEMDGPRSREVRLTLLGE